MGDGRWLCLPDLLAGFHQFTLPPLLQPLPPLYLLLSPLLPRAILALWHEQRPYGYQHWRQLLFGPLSHGVLCFCQCPFAPFGCRTEVYHMDNSRFCDNCHFEDSDHVFCCCHCAGCDACSGVAPTCEPDPDEPPESIVVRVGPWHTHDELLDRSGRWPTFDMVNLANGNFLRDDDGTTEGFHGDLYSIAELNHVRFGLDYRVHPTIWIFPPDPLEFFFLFHGYHPQAPRHLSFVWYPHDLVVVANFPTMALHSPISFVWDYMPFGFTETVSMWNDAETISSSFSDPDGVGPDDGDADPPDDDDNAELSDNDDDDELPDDDEDIGLFPPIRPLRMRGGGPKKRDVTPPSGFVPRQSPRLLGTPPTRTQVMPPVPSAPSRPTRVTHRGPRPSPSACRSGHATRLAVRRPEFAAPSPPASSVAPPAAPMAASLAVLPASSPVTVSATVDLPAPPPSVHVRRYHLERRAELGDHVLAATLQNLVACGEPFVICGPDDTVPNRNSLIEFLTSSSAPHTHLYLGPDCTRMTMPLTWSKQLTCVYPSAMEIRDSTPNEVDDWVNRGAQRWLRDRRDIVSNLLASSGLHVYARPVFAAGLNPLPPSDTHIDEYDAVITVLCGSKTFSILPPSALATRQSEGRPS